MKKPAPPKDWHCPRCGQLNLPDERWCGYCKLDRHDLQAWYVELAAG